MCHQHQSHHRRTAKFKRLGTSVTLSHTHDGRLFFADSENRVCQFQCSSVSAYRVQCGELSVTMDANKIGANEFDTLFQKSHLVCYDVVGVIASSAYIQLRQRQCVGDSDNALDKCGTLNSRRSFILSRWQESWHSMKVANIGTQYSYQMNDNCVCEYAKMQTTLNNNRDAGVVDIIFI